MKGQIKIKRKKPNDSESSYYNNDKDLNKSQLLKNNFIFLKMSHNELESIKSKLQFDTTQIIVANKLYSQNNELYEIINKFYYEIIDKIEAISEQILYISDCVKFFQDINTLSTTKNQSYSNSSHNSHKDNTHNVSIGQPNLTINNTNNGFSNQSSSVNHNIFKLSAKNFFIEKQQQLQKLENTLLEKNKLITSKTEQIEEDNKFLERIAKEKDSLVDSISEDYLRKVCDSFSGDNQIIAMKLVLFVIYKINIYNLSDKEIVETFRVR